jgi:hypothetical protein
MTLKIVDRITCSYVVLLHLNMHTRSGKELVCWPYILIDEVLR